MAKTSTSAMVSSACVRAPLGPCAARVVMWMVLSMVLLFSPSCAGECNILCSLLAHTHRQPRRRVDDPYCIAFYAQQWYPATCFVQRMQWLVLQRLQLCIGFSRLHLIRKVKNRKCVIHKSMRLCTHTLDSRHICYTRMLKIDAH